MGEWRVVRKGAVYIVWQLGEREREKRLDTERGVGRNWASNDDDDDDNGTVDRFHESRRRREMLKYKINIFNPA